MNNKKLKANKNNILSYLLSNIINIVIIIFICTYLYTITNLHFKIEDLDAFLYFFLFLFIPLFITIFIQFFYKIDFLKIYFLIFVIEWIIFLNVNPYPINIDNKFAIMELVPIQYRPHTQFLLSNINNNKFNYPIIIKPIYCSGNGNHIVIVNNNNELNNFIKECKNIDYYMIQNYLEEYNVEIGILYENGKIIEIVEKTNNMDKIRYFKDYNKKSHDNLIHNEKINYIINHISKLIPNMNVARYDIRLKNINDLEKGDFKIIEINGTMGMSFNNYFDIIWYFRRLFIGIINILTLKGYSPIHLPIVMYKSYNSMIKCNDYENIFSLYS